MLDDGPASCERLFPVTMLCLSLRDEGRYIVGRCTAQNRVFTSDHDANVDAKVDIFS